MKIIVLILCLILFLPLLAFADFYCTNCNKLIKEGSNFCSNCGTSFESQPQQQGNTISGIIGLVAGVQQYRQQRRYQKQQEEYNQMIIDQQKDLYNKIVNTNK